MPPPGPTEGSPVYFTTVPGYTFNASLTVLNNFMALAIQRGWSIGSNEWKQNWRKCFSSNYTDGQNPFVVSAEDVRFNFFADFPEYDVERSVTVIQNFKRLALRRGWTVNSPTWRRHWRACFGQDFTEDENPFADLAQSTFFHVFPDYQVNSTVSVLENFKCLSIKRGWRINSPAWRRHWKKCFGRAYLGLDQPFSRSEENEDADIDTDTGVSALTTVSSRRPPPCRPNPTVTLQAEFARVALSNGLQPRSREWRDARTQFFHEEFHRFFDPSTSKLENWQKLCRIIHVPVGESITQCKRALKNGSVMINLVNLVNHMRSLPSEQGLGSEIGMMAGPETGGPGEHVRLIKFESWSSFLNYTRKHPFPKQVAKANGFINALLRVLSRKPKHSIELASTSTI